MTRFIYLRLNDGSVWGLTGESWDSKSADVVTWDANETDHVVTRKRADLVDLVVVNIIWFRDNQVVYAG